MRTPLDYYRLLGRLIATAQNKLAWKAAHEEKRRYGMLLMKERPENRRRAEASMEAGFQEVRK